MLYAWSFLYFQSEDIFLDMFEDEYNEMVVSLYWW